MPAARRPSPTCALRRRLAPSVLAVVAAVAVAACGSSTSGPTIPAAHLEHQLAGDVASRYGLAKPTVTCPGGVANTAGTTFTCHTSLSGAALTINAVVHAPNDIRWQPADSVISGVATQEAIDERFSQRLGGSIQAACGAAPIRVVAVGSSFTCTATVKGSVRTFRVTATDTSGEVSLALLPPATGPGSTTPPVTAPGNAANQGSASTLPGD